MLIYQGLIIDQQSATWSAAVLNIQAADVSAHNGGWYEASQVARR